MLDLNKLSAQIRAASFEFKENQSELSERTKKAQLAFELALKQEKTMVSKLLEAEDLPWIMARPLEPLNKNHPLPLLPQQYLVFATDGSQISPSRHEVSPYYLINIGKIAYSYGTSAQPIQESEPFLYYRQKDLYTYHNWRHMGVNEGLIGLERTLMEFEQLALLCQTQESELPSIAMLDGALMGLLIDLPQFTPQKQSESLQRLEQALALFKDLSIPVCSYISESRKSECLSFLRLALCPFEKVRCQSLCEPEQESCKGFMPLSDTALWNSRLKPGERSPLFTNTQKYPEPLADHQMCFFYLHVGTEIARIELPRWAADLPQGLERLQSMIYSQVQKGQGYPIALAESHHRAVVKSQDRAQFYAMLSYKMIHQGLKVHLSNKELKKRKGIV